MNCCDSFRLVTEYFGKATSYSQEAWIHGHTWNGKGFTGWIRSTTYSKQYPLWFIQRRVIREKFSLCDCYFICSSEKVKLKAANNMVCIKKARRAWSTYAPGVIPRIMQQTISLAKMGQILECLVTRRFCSCYSQALSPKEDKWPVANSGGRTQVLRFANQALHQLREYLIFDAIDIAEICVYIQA